MVLINPSGQTITQHAIQVGAANNNVASVSVGSTGQVLQANTTADPTFSTATFPSVATTTGTILRADGTNWVKTTATYPATTTSQQILYSTADNVIGQLTTANSKLPATNSSGTLAMRAFSVVRQVFTSTGTYTPTAGMLYCDIEVVGGGGGGGGAATSGSGTGSNAGGGGGAEYARGVFSAATIGASQAVTIGAVGAAGTAGNNAGGTGGTSSVGVLITAIGGGGGVGSAAAAGGVSLGGIGGTGGSGGDFRTVGTPGINGIGALTFAFCGGAGGSSYFGGGAQAANNTTAAGSNGLSYGGGGSGATTSNGAQQAGGTGAKGIVVVTEYVIA